MSEYKITIFLKSNLHIGSGFGFARIIDHTSIKDAEKLVYIPGSTIKGKLRSICKKIALTLDDKHFWNKDEKICQTLEKPDVCKYETIAEHCVICRIFGSPFMEGRFLFSDAKLERTEAEKIKVLSKISRFRVDEQDEVKNSVKLSRVRRISDPQHLFTLESVSKRLKFEGVIHVRDALNQILNEDLVKAENDLLKYGLRSLTHLGGQKARGLGRIEYIYCPELGLQGSEGANE